MRKRKNKTNTRTEQDSRYFNERVRYKKLCKCGHNISLSPTKEKVICDWCGCYVFNSKKDEFLYRFNEAKNKGAKK